MVVSEGIKSKGELDLIESWGVRLVQGFYFSRPLSPAEILSVITYY